MALPRQFDVICAGDAHWRLEAPAGLPLRFAPGGGAVAVAFALAKRGQRVGLATVLSDDRAGRALAERLVGHRIDVGGVRYAPPRSNLVFVDSSAQSGDLLSYREEDRPVVIPAAWSSQVLVVSGVSPVVSYCGALCQAARTAKRKGAIVVVDVNARRHQWAGQNWRIAQMLLREAHVVHVSDHDLAALRVDVGSLRAALHSAAVIIRSRDAGQVWAAGPFGEVAEAFDPHAHPHLLAHARDAFTAAIAIELARAGQPGEGRPDLWARRLKAARAACLPHVVAT